MPTSYCCPCCQQLLQNQNNQFTCTGCNSTFPVVNNIPVLIDEQRSIFTINDYTTVFRDCHNDQRNDHTPATGIKATLVKALWFLQKHAPANTYNLKAKSNYAVFGNLLLSKTPKPKVLIIGGKTTGEGMQELLQLPITFVATDVAFGPNTQVICDAHHLPFANASFDGVIIQAVLEYLVDPYACVDEIHRVLKPGMPVYAETPFIQQVHGGAYDFTRFTHLGFKRLFRKFKEIDSGACVGTGSALAWSYKYFLLSFTNKKIVRELLLIVAAYTSFFLKYFDYFTIHNKATLDAASGYYFLGTQSEEVLSDRELIQQYQGMV